MEKIKHYLMSFAPLIGLMLLVMIFAILTEGRSVGPINIKILINQIIVVALVSIGAVYTFACRAIDMSLGGTMTLSAICGALIGLRYESFTLLVITIIIVVIILSLFKGVAAAYLNLPVFIVTLIFGMLLVAIGLVLMGSETNLSLRPIVPEYNQVVVNVTFLSSFFLLALGIFNYTKIGKSLKLLGGNPRAAEQIGINKVRMTITAFLFSGLGVTLATIMTLIKTKTVTPQTGVLGYNILIAIVIGGMPLTGGPRSKISAGLIGAATITVLNNGLSIMNVNNDIIQIIRGVIFLAVVFITSMGYRTKYLPR